MSCINCHAPDAFYDRIAIDGAHATMTITFKSGKVCRTCLEKTRADIRPVLDQLAPRGEGGA